MAELETHSNCCGIYHIEQFYNDDEEYDDGYEQASVAKYVGAYRPDGNERKLLEIVFNHDQCNEFPDTLRYMKEAGFRLVSEFNNSSGSDCFVFHRHNGDTRAPRPRILNELYPLGVGDAVGVVPAAPAPVPLFSTFHCVFADGRRGAGYDNLQEARDHLGRRRRIDQRQIMSNGAHIWTENVQ